MSELNDQLGGIKFCEHGNMTNDLNYCSICIELKSLNSAIIADGEYHRKQIDELEQKVEGLEKSIRHLQYTAIHRNDDNSIVVTSDLMNIKIKEGAET